MRRLHFRLTGLVYLFLLCSGCTTTIEIPTDAASKRTHANLVFLLDDALNAIGDPSSDYRSIFQNILATLPRDSPDLVKAEITDFLQRTPTSGMDFKCDAQLMRYRARQELWRL